MKRRGGSNERSEASAVVINCTNVEPNGLFWINDTKHDTKIKMCVQYEAICIVMSDYFSCVIYYTNQVSIYLAVYLI